jgi:hypothetical protein
MVMWTHGGTSRVLARCGGSSGHGGGGGREGQSSGIRDGEGEGSKVDFTFSSCSRRG